MVDPDSNISTLRAALCKRQYLISFKKSQRDTNGLEFLPTESIGIISVNSLFRK